MNNYKPSDLNKIDIKSTKTYSVTMDVDNATNIITKITIDNPKSGSSSTSSEKK